MAIVDSSSFPSLVYELLKGDAYSIGLHGVSTERARDLAGVTDTREVLDRVRENGLHVYSARSVNGTVAFCGRIDDKEDLENVSQQLRNYRYGNSNRYVLVAVPVVFRDKNGNQIYGGKANLDTEFKRFLDTTGNERSCISDIIILDEHEDIRPEYILGTYELLPDGKIDFQLNDKHVSQNGGVLLDEEFERLKRSFESHLYSLDTLKKYFTKKKLTEEDYAMLDKYLFIYSTVMGTKTNAYLPGITETIKQLIHERHLEKATAADYDAYNPKGEKNDYDKLYEGLEGEDLFWAKLNVLRNSHLKILEYDGKVVFTSDTPGEVEECTRIMNDEEFIDTLFAMEDPSTIRYATQLISVLSSDEIMKKENVYRGIMKHNYHGPQVYSERGLLNKDMLIDVATSSSFCRDTIYYLEEYGNDIDVVLAFIDNATFKNFPFYDNMGPNDIAIKRLGDDVKTNPLIYERMNERIKEFNQNNDAGYEPFDVDKMVKEAKGSSI